MMKGYFPEGWLGNTISNRKKTFTPLSITQSVQSGDILEADVLLCDADHNLIVNLGCMRGFVPRDEGAIGIKEGSVRDIALISRVGKPICFTVKSVETDSEGKMYALLSRRTAQQLCIENYIRKLVPGDVIDARITHFESFGAFCDIGCGVIAMLPIDAISVSRISHPRDRFRIGDDIKVVVRQIMPDGKIMLTHKELLGTWQQNAERICAGQTVSGIIRSVESYGVFVELTPNLAGLAEPKEDARVGQQASVFIKSVIPEKMKVKLIIIDSFDTNYVTPIEYFSDATHIDEWYYSPPDSLKQIYTQF